MIHFSFRHLWNLPDRYKGEDISSVKRLERAKQCEPLGSKEKIIQIMSDTQCEKFPVFRSGESPDYLTTVTVGKNLGKIKCSLMSFIIRILFSFQVCLI